MKQKESGKERKRKLINNLREERNLPAIVFTSGHQECSLEILNAEIRMSQLDALFRHTSSGILENMDYNPLQI